MSYQKLLEVLDHNSMNGLSNLLKKEFPTFFENIHHGDFQKWSNVINELPSVSSSVIDLNKGNIVIGKKSDCSNSERKLIKKQLKQLMPWRKGPYSLFGIYINSEWRSDMKWIRLQDDIKPLKNKLVLETAD